MTEEIQKKPATPGGATAIKAVISPVFTTWIYRCESGPIHLNDRLEELTHGLMKDSRNGTRRTNAGGWHYAFDLFDLQDPLVAEFRNIMEQHVQRIPDLNGRPILTSVRSSSSPALA